MVVKLTSILFACNSFITMSKSYTNNNYNSAHAMHLLQCQCQGHITSTTVRMRILTVNIVLKLSQLDHNIRLGTTRTGSI